MPYILSDFLQHDFPTIDFRTVVAYPEVTHVRAYNMKLVTLLPGQGVPIRERLAHINFPVHPMFAGDCNVYKCILW